MNTFAPGFCQPRHVQLANLIDRAASVQNTDLIRAEFTPDNRSLRHPGRVLHKESKVPEREDPQVSTLARTLLTKVCITLTLKLVFLESVLGRLAESRMSSSALIRSIRAGS